MKVPKLKIPLWQELVYLGLIMVAPIIITCIELFAAKHGIFIWSFASLGSILITIVILKRFVLKARIDKVKTKITLLEHDYSSGNGNADLIQAQWKTYNLILYIYWAISTAIVLGMCVLFIDALVNQIIAFRGASILILIFVIAGMVFKAFTFITLKGGKKE